MFSLHCIAGGFWLFFFLEAGSQWMGWFRPSSRGAIWIPRWVGQEYQMLIMFMLETAFRATRSGEIRWESNFSGAKRKNLTGFEKPPGLGQRL